MSGTSDLKAVALALTVDPTEDKSYKVIASTAVAFAIATLSIILRFAARWLCRKRLELNDYLILLAYIPKLGIDIASVLLVHYGIGRHITTLTPDDIGSYLKVLWTGSFLYAPCIALIKLSILSLYMAAFPSRYMRLSCWIIGSLVAAWGIALCITGLLACIPIHKSWSLNPLEPGRCIDTYAYYFGLQIPNILSDFAILFLPFKAVYDLHLPRTRMLQVLGVLSIGLLTCIFDIIRLVVLVQMPNTPDFSWDQVAASMWTDLEPAIAILAACLPIMRPLFHPRRFWRLRNEPQTLETELTDKDGDEQHFAAAYDAESSGPSEQKRLHSAQAHERGTSADTLATGSTILHEDRTRHV